MICVAMERSRDSRRANVSTVNGLRRRLRDAGDEDGRLDLQETVKVADRERLRKERDHREVTKRRRIERHTVAAQQRSGGDESSDSSDEEYCEEEDDVGFHRRNRFLSPQFFSVGNSRRGFRNLAASPELRNGVDEILGFLVPRRTRSATARKLHDSLDSRSGGFREELGHRKTSDPSSTVSLSSVRRASSASLVASSRKKMKSSGTKTWDWSCSSDSTRSSSMTPSDIEIEAAEALFDLMKQSHSQTRTRPEPEKPDKDEVKTPKAGVKDENNSFSDEDEASTKVKIGEVGIVKDKSEDDEGTEEELVPMKKREVGSVKESETLSYVKANARDIRDLTATNANHAADSVAKRGIKLEIDLMASPPSSPERDASIYADHQAVKGVSVEQKPGISQQLIPEDFKNPLLPSSGGMNNWDGVLPREGYMPRLQAVCQMDASSNPSVKFPRFKLSEPRPKRCALHHYIASNIQQHQQLKSSSRAPTDLALNLNAVLTAQNLVSGDLKKSVSISGSPTSVNDSPDIQTLCQHALYQASTNTPSCSSGFIYPIGQLQSSKKLPPSSAASTGNTSLSSKPAGRPTSLPFAGGVAAAAPNFNHPIFPPNESAPPRFIASIPNNGCCPVPTSANMAALPPFKGVSPLFDPCLFSSPIFSVPQNQQLPLSHAPKLPTALQSSTTSSLPQTQTQSLQQKKKHPEPPSSRSSPLGGGSFLSQAMNFGMIPQHLPMSSDGGDPPCRSKVELLPRGFPLPFGTNDSQNSGIFPLLPDVGRSSNQPASQPKKSCSPASDAMKSGQQFLNFSKLSCAPDFPLGSGITFPETFSNFSEQQLQQQPHHRMGSVNQHQQPLMTFGNAAPRRQDGVKIIPGAASSSCMTNRFEFLEKKSPRF